MGVLAYPLVPLVGPLLIVDENTVLVFVNDLSSIPLAKAVAYVEHLANIEAIDVLHDHRNRI